MKTKLFAAGAALCMLGMTGCSKDMMENVDVPAGQQVTMNMQTSGPQTRAVYSNRTNTNKMDFSWSNDDAISVMVNGTSNKNCRLTASTSGKSVLFSGNVTAWTESPKTIYAFYPYNSAPYTVTGANLPETATAALTLPNPQTYTVDGAISNSIMVGKGTATATDKTISASASMKQVMSIVQLNITKAPSKVKSVKLSSTEAIFPTMATVTLSTAEVSLLSTLTNELSMTVTDNTTKATKAVSFAMFPADLSAKKIRIEVTFEGGKSKTIEKDGTNFLRNTHYMVEFDGEIPWISKSKVGFPSNIQTDKKYAINKDSNGIRLLPIDAIGSRAKINYGNPKTWLSLMGGSIKQVLSADLMDDTKKGISLNSKGQYEVEWHKATPNLTDITKDAYVITSSSGIINTSKFTITLEGQYVSWQPFQYLGRLRSDGKSLILYQLYRLNHQNKGYGKISVPENTLFHLADGWTIKSIKNVESRLKHPDTSKPLEDVTREFYGKMKASVKMTLQNSQIQIECLYPYSGFTDIEVELQKKDITKTRHLRVYVVG